MLRHQDEVRVERSGIRIRDVAILDVTAFSKASIGDIVIARIPANRSSVTLQKSQIASLIRRVLPIVAIRGAQAGSIRFEVASASAKTGETRDCAELLVSRESGEVLSSNDVKSAVCPAHPVLRSVRYDGDIQSHVAARPLASGAIIPMVRFEPPASVHKGDRLTLISAAGPVRIDRPVTALQAAHLGDHRIFVRTDEGEVFSVRTELQQGDRQ